jgi:hypothetical protein
MSVEDLQDLELQKKFNDQSLLSCVLCGAKCVRPVACCLGKLQSFAKCESLDVTEFLTADER